MDHVPFVSRTLHVVLGSVEVDKILQFARYGTGDDQGSGKVALFRDSQDLGKPIQEVNQNSKLASKNFIKKGRNKLACVEHT